MAVKPVQNPPSAYVETVAEITRIHRSLPPRPSIEEVEAALTVLRIVNHDEEFKLEEIAKLEKPQDVPEQLFFILQEFKKNTVLIESLEQRREAVHLVDLDKLYDNLDELIQQASSLVSGDDTDDQTQVDLVGGVGSISERKGVFTSDESLIKKSTFGGVKLDFGGIGSISERKDVSITDESLIKKNRSRVKLDTAKGLVHSSSTRASLYSGNKVTEKYSLMKLASVIELTAKNGETILDLQAKLMDKIEWLLESLGKLSAITELNISDNHIMALPSTIGSLKGLRKFDAHSNQLINLPDSFGELENLVDLDLNSNRLKSLPAAFGSLKNLMNLDLSYNSFTLLPDTLGGLVCLKVLNVEKNNLEELPYSIGSCSALEQLILDSNYLRALPEATGKLEYLEVLKVHYNRIKSLPSTIGNLTKLKELDVSTNEIEFIPENLSSATSLVRLDVSNNFADLTALPRSIGKLVMLEELDISNCQIRFLPESFMFLSNLRVFKAYETPLEVPPRRLIGSEAQVVVQYMVDLVAMGDVTAKPSKKKNIWYWLCSLFRPRKHSSLER